MPRIVKLGKVTNSNKFIWQPQDHGIFIESLAAGSDVLAATLSVRRFYAPVDATSVIIFMKSDDAFAEEFPIYLRRDGDALDTFTQVYIGSGPAVEDIAVVWGSNYITIDASDANSLISNIYFYT